MVRQLTGRATGYLVCLVCLAMLQIAGCSTPGVRAESWSYVGADPALAAPFTVSDTRRQQIAAELGAGQPGTPSPSIQAGIRADFEAWKQYRSAAIDAARQACSRGTGQAAEPIGFGRYDDAFLTCMQGRGWRRSASGDPL